MGCKIVLGELENRIWCDCGFIKRITGEERDYNYCPRCGKLAERPSTLAKENHLGNVMMKGYYQGFNEEMITSCKMNECKHNKRGKCVNDSMIVSGVVSDGGYFETCDGFETAESEVSDANSN